MCVLCPNTDVALWHCTARALISLNMDIAIRLKCALPLCRSLCVTAVARGRSALVWCQLSAKTDAAPELSSVCLFCYAFLYQHVTF